QRLRHRYVDCLSVCCPLQSLRRLRTVAHPSLLRGRRTRSSSQPLPDRVGDERDPQEDARRDTPTAPETDALDGYEVGQHQRTDDDEERRQHRWTVHVYPLHPPEELPALLVERATRRHPSARSTTRF